MVDDSRQAGISNLNQGENLVGAEDRYCRNHLICSGDSLGDQQARQRVARLLVLSREFLASASRRESA